MTKNKKQASAGQRVLRALKNGELVRPQRCESCKKEGKVFAHHWSYEKEHQLDVKWLCYDCHYYIHGILTGRAKTEFCNWLNQCFQKFGGSHSSFADECGYPRTKICRWLHGRSSVSIKTRNNLITRLDDTPHARYERRVGCAGLISFHVHYPADAWD